MPEVLTNVIHSGILSLSAASRHGSGNETESEMWYIVRDEETKKYVLKTRSFEAMVAKYHECIEAGHMVSYLQKPDSHNQIQACDYAKVRAELKKIRGY